MVERATLCVSAFLHRKELIFMFHVKKKVFIKITFVTSLGPFLRCALFSFGRVHFPRLIALNRDEGE